MKTILLSILLALAIHPQFKPGDMVPDSYVRAVGTDSFFTSEEIPDSIFSVMTGRSYPGNCTIRRSSLRYIKVLHKNAKGQTLVGELVAGKAIARDLLDIFKALYNASYPIERMRLIDIYDASDDLSMKHNNSSCFNYRTIGNTGKISAHGLGLAVDINPLYNPYWKKDKSGKELVSPAEGRPYVNRKGSFPYKISAGDLCCRLFKAHGFVWGGDWRSCKDYQHFEKKN